MAAISAAARAPRGVFAPRTVFVRASPPPLSLAERRAVLHALKRHCRIDFFRKIKNNPSSFLSMAESWEAAEALIAKSPLTYRLATDAAGHTAPTPPNETGKPPTNAAGHAAPAPPNATEEPPTSERPTPGKASASSPADGTKAFVIHIFPRSAGKKHAEMVRDSPLYGPWPARPDTTSFAARNLRMSIPEGAMRDCLADWETGGQPKEDGALVEERGDSDYYLRREQRRDDGMGLSGVFQGA